MIQIARITAQQWVPHSTVVELQQTSIDSNREGSSLDQLRLDHGLILWIHITRSSSTIHLLPWYRHSVTLSGPQYKTCPPIFVHVHYYKQWTHLCNGHPVLDLQSRDKSWAIQSSHTALILETGGWGNRRTAASLIVSWSLARETFTKTTAVRVACFTLYSTLSVCACVSKSFV